MVLKKHMVFKETLLMYRQAWALSKVNERECRIKVNYRVLTLLQEESPGYSQKLRN